MSSTEVEADELIDSPLFNYHNRQQQQDDSSDAGALNRAFTQDDDEDLSLPPPTSELPYPLRETRESIYSGADLETLQDADFPDADKDCGKTRDESDKIIREIKAVVLFNGYDDTELLVVVDYMYPIPVSRGDVIIEHGGVGDAFYVVRSGQFQCALPSAEGERHPIRTYNGDGYFGELALINQAPRAATITATTDGELWVLSALRYSWLRKRRAMSNAEQFEQLIKAIPLFRNNLSPCLTNRLIDAIEVVSLDSGDVICKQGEPGDSMYFVIEGEVEATINDKRVKIMAKNDFFGERALIMDEGRAATCCAIAKSRLAKLPRESFELLIPDNVIDKMRCHIAVSYDSVVDCDNAVRDDVTDDEFSTTSVYMEYFCQDVKK